MLNKSENREQGAVEVEAAVILPLACLSVFLLLYLSLFLFQRASLQACLETSLVYYKNTVTDTFVKKKETLSDEDGEGSSIKLGNDYTEPVPLSPYRNMFGDGGGLNSEEGFERYFLD